MIPDLIASAFDNSVKKVTNIRTISSVMLESSIYQKMLTEVHKLPMLYFTFPVLTSTAERSFSTLRRIKTFLWSTMTKSRLNTLNLEAIASEFTSTNRRRINYFGKP